MGGLAVGAVVAVTFPFADFSRFKKRPALVIGLAEFDNVILCQITSSAATSRQAIRLTNKDFVEGKLPVQSYIRPDKIVTVDPSLVQDTLGMLSPEKRDQVLQKVRTLFAG